MVNINMQANFHNIYGQVEVNPLIYQHWVDALGEFASSVRIRRGLLLLVKIDEEVWYQNDVGDLIIIASIDDEIMQMVVPKGLWEWL